MKYLITGGAGFIGSHLADYLLDLGHRVVVMDDLSTGKSENIAHLVQRDGFQFVKASVLNETEVNKCIKTADVVFHLAAVVGVRYTLTHQQEVLDVNLKGTQHVLEACKKSGKNVLLSSSSEVYQLRENLDSNKELSDDEIILIPEHHEPRWTYAVSKLQNEQRAMRFYREDGLPVVISRLFNIAGSRQNADLGMVLPEFWRNAVSNQNLRISGDGSQKRAFTHVLDAVRAMVLLSETEQAAGEIVNIGSSNEISITELAERIIQFTGSDSKIIYQNLKELIGTDFDDVKRRRPDISKLQKLTRFSPQRSLEEIFEQIAKEESTLKLSQ